MEDGLLKKRGMRRVRLKRCGGVALKPALEVRGCSKRDTLCMRFFNVAGFYMAAFMGPSFSYYIAMMIRYSDFELPLLRLYTTITKHNCISYPSPS